MITGQKFEVPRDLENINQRIVKNVTDYLNVEKTVNILLVGSGSREHAIAEAVNKSTIESKLFCISTAINPGIENLAQGYLDNICNCNQVLEYAKSQHIDIAIIGLEAPLEVGLTYVLKAEGIGVVGPTKKLAQIETSKGFTRDLIRDYGIGANPFFKKFSTMDEVEETLR
ncbi:MAG: hypothetical protein AB8V18_07280 [Francisella endosymbiont of Hyalomma asiaticum]